MTLLQSVKVPVAVQVILTKMSTSVLLVPTAPTWAVLRTTLDLATTCLLEDNTFLPSSDPTPTPTLTINIIVIPSLKSIITSFSVNLHSSHLLVNFQIRNLERVY